MGTIVSGLENAPDKLSMPIGMRKLSSVGREPLGLEAVVAGLCEPGPPAPGLLETRISGLTEATYSKATDPSFPRERIRISDPGKVHPCRLGSC